MEKFKKTWLPLVLIVIATVMTIMLGRLEKLGFITFEQIYIGLACFAAGLFTGLSYLVYVTTRE